MKTIRQYSGAKLAGVGGVGEVSPILFENRKKVS